MNILFIHQNFPGQFKFLAPALVQQGHTVVAMTMQKTRNPRPAYTLGCLTLRPRPYAGRSASEQR